MTTIVGFVVAAAVGVGFAVGFEAWAGDDDKAFDVWLYSPLLAGALSAARALGHRKGKHDERTYLMALGTVAAWAAGAFAAQFLIEGASFEESVGGSAVPGVIGLFAAAGAVALLHVGMRRWKQLLG